MRDLDTLKKDEAKVLKEIDELNSWASYCMYKKDTDVFSVRSYDTIDFYYSVRCYDKEIFCGNLKLCLGFIKDLKGVYAKIKNKQHEIILNNFGNFAFRSRY